MELHGERNSRLEERLFQLSKAGLIAVGVLGSIHLFAPSAVPHNIESLLQMDHMTSIMATTWMMYCTASLAAQTQKEHKPSYLPIFGAALAGMYHFAAESGRFPAFGYPDITDMIYGIAAVFPASICMLKAFKIDTGLFAARQQEASNQPQ